MPDMLNIAEAKAHLSALVDRAAAGEEILIAKAGKPLARLVPLAAPEPRPFGVAKHWKIADDLFLEPSDPADLDAAEGADTDPFGISRGRRP
ncbi:MAG TPA: type II toxin-antitoxin system prevent-host-death family antitoxin [Azospirillum sp.]